MQTTSYENQTHHYLRAGFYRRAAKLEENKMPYYDDEMTDHAVKAWITWAKKRYGTFAQPNRYETFRHGNTINIGRYDGRPIARYR